MFKKTVTKFEADIEDFRQQYFQPKAETSFSANSTSSDKKLSPSAFKLSSRFLRSAYNKFIRDQNQSRSASANSLNLSSIFEVKEKQPNISKAINSSSIFFADSSQDRSRSESVVFSSIEASAEEIIYNHFIDPQLENMAPPIGDAVIQAAVNAAINRGLENMMNKIQKMIFNTQRAPDSQGQRGPQSSQGIQGSQEEQETQGDLNINAVDGSGNRWHADDVGFFDSYYEGKSSSFDSALEYAGKDIIFRNIHVFIDRVKDVTESKKWKIIRDNLSTCLKGQALIWYTFELTDDIRRLLKYDDQLKKWSQTLIKQFRKSPAKSMEVIVNEKYTMKDVTNGRESRQFAQIIIRATRSVELLVYNQLQIIWNALDAEFQRDILMLKAFTTLSDFLTAMNKRKKIWWKLAEGRRQNFDKKKKPFSMKKDYEREQERNDKYPFYQNRYTRFEGPRGRDRGTMNPNFLRPRMN